MIKSENIYKYRSYIRNLYLNNTSLEGDIADEIKDNSKIEKSDIDIKNFYIGIFMSKDAERINVDDVISKVSDTIQKFILTNIGNIPLLDEEKEEFNEFINNNGLLYDKILVGNLIKFVL